MSVFRISQQNFTRHEGSIEEEPEKSAVSKNNPNSPRAFQTDDQEFEDRIKSSLEQNCRSILDKMKPLIVKFLTGNPLEREEAESFFYSVREIVDLIGKKVDEKSQMLIRIPYNEKKGGVKLTLPEGELFKYLIFLTQIHLKRPVQSGTWFPPPENEKEGIKSETDETYESETDETYESETDASEIEKDYTEEKTQKDNETESYLGETSTSNSTAQNNCVVQ